MTGNSRHWTEAGKRVGWLSFPPYFGYFAVPLGLFLLLGSNPLLGMLSFAALVIGVGVLWRPGEIPILLFFFGWQWLEASLALIRSSISGEPLADMVEIPSQMDTATMLALIGLVALALGMRVAVGAHSPELQARYRNEVCSIRVERWATAYAIAFVLAIIIQEIAIVITPLAQPLIALANLKWAFFVTFTFAVFARPRGYRVLWLAVFAFEFIFSLGGFFSSFKLVFIFAFLGLLAAGARVQTKHAIPLALVGAIALSLGIVWSAIKQDYRSYITLGTDAQSVLVSRSEQVSRMMDLTQELSGDDIVEAFDALMSRIAYVQYFGAALNYVPEVRPHTEGDLVAKSIANPFMPRALFPNKEIIDESRHTNQFTNLGVAGLEQGTQISIGYFGDSYIDFGKFGMMGLLFAIGLVFGWFYRSMMKGKRVWGVLGGSIAAAVMVGLASVGNSMAKLWGGFLIALLVIWIFNRTIMPLLQRWLRLTRARPFLHAAPVASRRAVP